MVLGYLVVMIWAVCGMNSNIDRESETKERKVIKHV
jgi:hypothetical protein